MAQILASRRHALLGAAAALTAAPLVPAVAATQPADPDAVLIRLCREAIDCETRSDEMTLAVNDVLLSDPRWTAAFAASRVLMDRYNVVIEQVEHIPALTAAGLQAKAELVKLHMYDGQDDFGIVHSLLRDVLAVGA